ncbi:cysteine-rich motor neuron 1 protein-like [Acropora muricata]|uniref:cysteine-rich motor neuron 1 protein-like n=1 Tax=Acropora millepora TaxID=45264 RepID=UPI0010FCB6FE|nr:cysteine-rich motor neuron 1 protein-like [Acropora millepora]XP_044179970.1 cysteine-rich motor neuron 1 protein-like [Acropora millepora]
MVTLPLLWVFLGALSVVSPFTCRFCDRTDCGAPLKCKGSIGYDACGCCPQCAQLEGQKCGGDWGELGFCDPGLRCVHGICSSAKKKPQPCTPRSLNVQSDCPSGFWCKIQIPGIPDADIPDLAVCVKGKPQVSATTKASTVSTANRQGKLPDECKHPPSGGPCKAAFPRWYYNMVKRKCKEFLYGGCDGNANNFQTEAACKSFCMQQNISSGPVVKHTPTPQIERTKAAVPTSSGFRMPSTTAPVTSESRRTKRPRTILQKGKSPIAKCHDSPSNKFYGEDETWEPNDCTVCVCRNGTPECLATVCRHPDCKEPIYIKGQCCPVCPLVYPNTSYQKEADLIKAFAENKLDTVLVSINHGGKQDVCHDIRTGKNYLVGQSWQLDQCTTCYCGKSGKAACALQMCERDPKCKDLLIDNNECCPKCKDENVVKSTSKCYDTITKKYYGEAELWQRNKCTSCFCGNDRKPVCTHTVCPPVFCELPMDIEERCCPVCPANIQKGCMFDGQRFLHGDSKLLMDKCTLCICDNGDWHCTRDRCQHT